MITNVLDLERATIANEDYRRVIFTGHDLQLVLMTLAPGEDIGSETHEEHDQFIRVESGIGKVSLNHAEYPVTHGTAIVIPAGMEHNLINTSSTQPLRFYTLYGPPEHPDGTVHPSKADEPCEH
jgi:mannose-6-phosphate isomerase-like protein (cupin superfamily)